MPDYFVVDYVTIHRLIELADEESGTVELFEVRVGLVVARSGQRMWLGRGHLRGWRRSVPVVWPLVVAAATVALVRTTVLIPVVAVSRRVVVFVSVLWVVVVVAMVVAAAVAVRRSVLHGLVAVLYLVAELVKVKVVSLAF